MTPATVDMEALIKWGLSQDPPACRDGIERARRGWGQFDVDDRYWVALRCGPELLEVLAQDPDAHVRRIVAERCGPELHEVLAMDFSFYVRWAVARHCGPGLLKALSQDPDYEVRRVAAERLKENS